MEQAALSAGPDGVVRPGNLALAPIAAARRRRRRRAPDRRGRGATLPQMERDSLVRALERTGGNVSRAARVLGISRDTMRYRIAKHGLEAVVAGTTVDAE